jgi:hypothetical protein
MSKYVPIKSNQRLEPEMRDDRTPSDYVKEFWAAPDDAWFPQEALTPVLNKSCSWFEKHRWAGTGIPYTRIGRKPLYQKRDVLRELEKNRVEIARLVSGVAT